jgi:hypothetical protein
MIVLKIGVTNNYAHRDQAPERADFAVSFSG